jgi:signal transduction histidine kinase
LSKIEEGKVEATFILFDIKSLIEEVIDEMKGILKDGQLINYNHFGNSKINLDPKLFRNVLINLISNAIKFSEENKIIEIETHVEDLIFKLSVKDNGIGISEEDKEHLFQRFFRGQNATNIQGTGLGLNIIASYVEHMSGKISVESKLEVGTKFIIEFKNNN